MSKYLKLSDFNHLRNHKSIVFKEEIVNNKKVTIVFYNYQDPDIWKQPLGIECRGVCFDENGELIGLPFQKFFNVNEREETKLENIDISKCDKYEKRDGSRIDGILINDEVVFKTNKSFYSDVAIAANKYANDEDKSLSRYLLEENITPLFEFTYPINKIVVEYNKEPKFVLLNARCMITGKFIDREKLEQIAKLYNVDIIKKYNKTKEELLDDIEHLEGFEGYVLVDGEKFYKWKTRWYILNHRIMTGIRTKDIALRVIEETIDDVKSLLISEGYNIDLINNIEEQVINELNSIINSIKEGSENIKSLEPKEAFKLLGKHKYFKYMMRLVKNPDTIINYKQLWMWDYYKNYDLIVCYNPAFSKINSEE